MINKRKDKRFEQANRVNTLFTLHDKDFNSDEPIEALTYNLSLSGAMILTTKKFPVGAVIRSDIQLSGSNEVVRVDGRVKWIHEVDDEDRFAIGVEFLHEISKTLLSLIRHLYSKEEGVPSAIGKS